VLKVIENFGDMKVKTSALKLFLRFYISTIFVLFILSFFIILQKNNYSVDTTAVFFQDVVVTMLTSALFYIISAIPYLIFLLIKNIVSDYKRNKINGLLKGTLLKVAILTAALFVGNSLLKSYRLSEVMDYTWDVTVENNSTRVNNNYSIDKKQKGIHVFNISGNTADLEQLKTNNFEWITLTPFINQSSYNEPSLRLISDDRYTNLLKHYKAIKEECDKYGIRIMLKPHIWL
jgi:hypothetical protein